MDIAILAASVLGDLLVLALVLYGLWDVFKASKKQALLNMILVASRLTELECRMASGKLRSQSECDEANERYLQAAQEVERYGELKTPL